MSVVSYLSKVVIMEKKKLTVKVDKRIVEAAETVLEGLGLRIDEAVNIFLYQVFYTQSIPFPVKLPTDEMMTRCDLYFKIYEELAEVDAGKGISGEEVFTRLREKYGMPPRVASNNKGKTE